MPPPIHPGQLVSSQNDAQNDISQRRGGLEVLTTVHLARQYKTR